MSSGLERINEVVLESDAADSELAHRLRRWASQRGVPLRLEQPGAAAHAAAELEIDSSKQTLRVVRHRGAVLKPCTGRTDSLLCCNLHVVTQTVGCPLDCSYCILQDYQNRSGITVHADPHEILDRLAADLAAQPPGRLVRVCTGQVADSLALEPLLGFVAPAVTRFAGFSSAVLELKTKTDRVDPLIGLPHNGRTIVSWSIAPPDVVAREEHRCASLRRRLEAAGRVARDGYLVAFHLDPMISGARDQQRYSDVVSQALEAVPLQRVAYVSMGTVRFLPSMRRTLAVRFPRSRVPLGELLPDVDGKLRLLAPRRIALYRAVASRIRHLAPEVFVYLCMEPSRVWRRALGVDHGHRDEVEQAISDSLDRRFGLRRVPSREQNQ